MAEKKRYRPQNVRQRADDPITADQFEVYFGNSIKIGFSRISNISLGQDVSVITDFGNDDRHYYYKDKDDDDIGDNVIVLERGVSTDESDKLLRTYQAGVIIENLMIRINQNGKAIRMLSVKNAVVSKFGFSDLDASASSVMMRRLEIRHDGIEELDI